jgi:hypothetical protein
MCVSMFYFSFSCAQRLQSMMRPFVSFVSCAVPAADLAHHRRRWLALHDVPSEMLQGWLEIQLPGPKKKTFKLYFALVVDVLYYWKTNKKPEVNLGRLLVDKSIKIDLLEVGKKKFELRLIGWKAEEFYIRGKAPLLKQWFEALQHAQSGSTLDLCEVYVERDKRSTGRTSLTQGKRICFN